MPALKIGIQLADLKLSLRSALTTAARLGANAVELDARGAFRPATLSQSGIREIRKLLADLSLRVSAISFATLRGYNVPDRLEARIAGTKAAMKLAYDLGAAVVVNHVGEIPPPPAEGEPESESWNLLIDALTEIGKYGQHVGATLAAQTGTTPIVDLDRLLHALPDGSLAIDYCPAAMVASGDDPLAAIDTLGRYIQHVHAGDAMRDRARGRGQIVPLGRGMVDWPVLLATLEQHGYRGYFTLESPGGSDAVVALGAAVQYLRSL